MAIDAPRPADESRQNAVFNYDDVMGNKPQVVLAQARTDAPATPGSGQLQPTEIPANDPRALALKNYNELFERVQKGEQDPTLNKTFAHGKDMNDLAMLMLKDRSPQQDQALGAAQLSRELLRGGLQVMMNPSDKPSGQPGDAEEDRKVQVTNSMVGLARNLQHPLLGETASDRINDLKLAESLFAQAYVAEDKEPRITSEEAEAHKPGRTPEEMADILQMRSDVQFQLAMGSDVRTPAGWKVVRGKMDDIIAGTNAGLDLLKDQNRPGDIERKAYLNGSLAHAEDTRDLYSEPAPPPKETLSERFSEWVSREIHGDPPKEIPPAQKHYGEALSLWNKFDPNDQSIPEAFRDLASVTKDREVLDLALNYHRYAVRKNLEAEKGTTQKLIDIIYNLHPDWVPGARRPQKH